MSQEFKPFVPADSRAPEMTLKAIGAGLFLSLVFGAANAYLALKAGQTIGATIPAAVIAIALFRLPFFRGGVLEQNVARTGASVGEALVAGAAFTIPAFLLVQVGGVPVWADFREHYWESTVMLLAGGLLGVFFIILLRRPLAVDAKLPFPESTACAEIVKAGQGGSADAPRYIFGAMGLGAVLQLLTNSRGILVFRESLDGFLEFPRAVIRHFGYDKAPIGDVAHSGGVPWTTPLASPALMGIGYIIGPRLAAINFSGSIIAWWVLIPLVLFIDPDLPRRLTGAAEFSWDLAAYSVWYNVVRPIAVGTMLVAAVYTLYSMRESLFASVRGALATRRGGAPAATSRIERDIPLRWILISIGGLVVPITFIYYHFTQALVPALVAGAVMTVAGFVLAAVGGYLVGLVGVSNQPVSGLTIAALVVAALLMVAVGMRGVEGVAAVLGVAAVVCIACSVAGSLIQDLKAGHLLGGTPWKMQVTEIISVVVLAFFLMWPLVVLHQDYGIGSRELPAPQAGLMAVLASGIVGGDMAWGLVGMGIVFGVALILVRAPAPMLIAVGMYLPLSTTSAIFAGGILKWAADRIAARKQLTAAGAEAFEQRGTLLASGFIAGEAILAILLSGMFILAVQAGVPEGRGIAEGDFSLLAWLTGSTELGVYRNWGGWLSLIVFAAVGAALVYGPFRKRLPE
jgi:putative OPT family oligopeptide transporter